jgi:arginyl-tRNA--protein-N-Asp/Glu arginylyltransferase
MVYEIDKLFMFWSQILLGRPPCEPCSELGTVRFLVKYIAMAARIEATMPNTRVSISPGT